MSRSPSFCGSCLLWKGALADCSINRARHHLHVDSATSIESYPLVNALINEARDDQLNIDSVLMIKKVTEKSRACGRCAKTFKHLSFLLARDRTSAAASADSAVSFSIIVVYGNIDNSSNDPWVVKIDDDVSDAKIHAAEVLLRCSPKELKRASCHVQNFPASPQPISSDDDDAAPSASSSSSSAAAASSSSSADYDMNSSPEFPVAINPAPAPVTGTVWPWVGEYQLTTLHMLSEMLTKLRARPNSHAQFIFVPSSALLAAVRKHLTLGTLVHRQSLFDTRRSVGPFDLDDGRPSESKVNVQYVATWKDAVSALKHPLAAFYLPTIMWLRHAAPLQECKQAITELLGDASLAAATASHSVAAPTPCRMVPPFSVNDVSDDKKATNEEFKDHQVPQQWFNVCDRSAAGATSVVAQITNWATSLGGHAVPPRIVVKGATSTCGYSKLDFKHADVGERYPGMLIHVTELIDELHQHCIGVQLYHSGLAFCEYRFWCIPHIDQPKERYTIVAAVQTMPPAERHGLLSVYGADMASRALQRCAALVETLFTTHSTFWQLLLNEPNNIHAIRIDTFYDATNDTAYLNELAPAPDGVMWTNAHNASLVRHIGVDMACSILTAADAYGRPSSSSASAAPSASSSESSSSSSTSSPYP